MIGAWRNDAYKQYIRAPIEMRFEAAANFWDTIVNLDI